MSCKGIFVKFRSIHFTKYRLVGVCYSNTRKFSSQVTRKLPAGYLQVSQVTRCDSQMSQVSLMSSQVPKLASRHARSCLASVSQVSRSSQVFPDRLTPRLGAPNGIFSILIPFGKWSGCQPVSCGILVSKFGFIPSIQQRP